MHTNYKREAFRVNRKLNSILIFLSICSFAFFFPSISTAEGVNLIPNGNLESSGATGTPLTWKKGGYGTNSRSLSYPVAGYQSEKAVRVEITSYTSGDAKWFFAPISVEESRAYKFSNVYKSNANNFVTIQFTLSDGTLKYLDLGKLNPSSAWTPFTGTFTTPPKTVSITIFHLIKSAGFLETDSFFLERIISDPNKFDKGYISINFDDGWLPTYQNAFPILNSAGYKTDSFIVTDRLVENDFPGYMKANHVLDIQAFNHVVGAHTKNHSNLTLLSTAEAVSQINDSRSALLNIGASPINYFAYPFGGYNDSVKQLVKNAGFIAARSSDGGYNQKTQDKFALRRQPMVNTTTLSQIKSYIDTALQEKTWVILLFHQVDSSGTKYSVTPELFQQTIDYLKEKNVTPITIGEGVALMNQ